MSDDTSPTTDDTSHPFTDDDLRQMRKALHQLCIVNRILRSRMHRSDGSVLVLRGSEALLMELYQSVTTRTQRKAHNHE